MLTQGVQPAPPTQHRRPTRFGELGLKLDSLDGLSQRHMLRLLLLLLRVVQPVAHRDLDPRLGLHQLRTALLAVTTCT